MDKNLKGLLWTVFIIVIFGGVTALKNVGTAVIQFLLMLFPIFGEKIIENYFTSPYFIVGIIMAVCSSFGIYFGVKGGKILFAIVAIILLSVDLLSIGLNAF